MEPAFSYDEMPYSNKFFPQTHPDRLATVATLFDMSPAPITKCRVLELGCGNGSNLIYQAVTLPGSEFVGIDLAAGHIDLAKKSAEELGVANVAFHQMDVTKMTAGEFGKFDYIIAHGLFSWVPDFVRESILDLYRKMLTPDGVGYISYNAYPGAHYREMPQEMKRFYTRKIESPMEKVKTSREFIKFLHKNASDQSVYKVMLEHEVMRQEDLDPELIFHDDLAEVNKAYYFYEFADLLQKNELQFISEEKLSSISLQKFSPEAKRAINSIEDVIEREQYIDFLKGRVFRQTLICHKEVTLDRNISPSRMDEFFVDSYLKPESPKPETTTNKIENFTGIGGINIQIDHPLTKTVMVMLWNKPQGSQKFDATLEAARKTLENEGYKSDDWSRDLEIARAILFQITCETGLVNISLFERPSINGVSEKPKAHALVRWQLRFGDTVATPLNIAMKMNDPVAKYLIELLDGSKTKADLIPILTEFIKTNDEIENKDEFLNEISLWFDQNIAQFTKIGMFT